MLLFYLMEGTHSENPGLGATPREGIFSNAPHLPKRKVSVLVKDCVSF